MKIEELKALVGKHTQENEINYEELNKAINTEFDAVIDRKVEKAKELAKNDNVAEFIKEQGFENIDQFTASVKNSKATATELSEKVTRYETELDALRNENGKLKTENDEYTYMSKLDTVDPKYKKFVMSEIRGLVNDTTDFDSAKETYLADNAHYLRDNETKITTKLPKGGTNLPKTDGVIAALERKHNIKLE